MTPTECSLHAHVLHGLRILAGHCDGARARDDVGFDASDTNIGHTFAGLVTLTPSALRWGISRCHKYRRQLGEEFFGRLIGLELLNPIQPSAPVVQENHGDNAISQVRQLESESESSDEDQPPFDPLLSDPLDDVFPLTDEQEFAIDTIRTWLDQNDKPEFKLGGYAGTGKTTVTKVLRSDIARRYSSVVCAFTGKAVNVLQRKGVRAQTLHSLMYDVNEDPKTGEITFSKKVALRDDPALIIVDEASMISTELYNDLKSFDVPLLFVGDPGQLEPVGDNPNLMAHPDLVLSKIHRQAEKSPIIRLATDIRLGRIARPAFIDGPELTIKSKVVRASEYMDASQVICAKNTTRRNLNDKIRQVKGYPTQQLVLNEKLICLRNNRQHGVFNGMILFVRRIHRETSTAWVCDLEDEVGGKFNSKHVWKEPFLLPIDKNPRVPFNHIWCDFGYVITCHKSQGSEWEHVLVLDEWMPPSVWDMKRWRYTAITRAAKRLTFCV